MATPSIPPDAVASTTPRARFYLPALSGPALGLVGVLVLFTLLIGSKGDLDKFWSLPNIQVLFHEITIPGVVALGALLVILSGGIDLSVGSIVALVTVVTMQVYRLVYERNGPGVEASLAAVACGIAAGGVCGLTNGLVITRLRVPPFVATLGMLSIARGLAVWLSERRVIAFPGSDPQWVKVLNQVDPGLLVFNPGFWSLVLLAILTILFLRFTIWGRYIYAIGSNEATARLCGVPIAGTKVLVYTLAGLLTGWAGILHFAHGASGDPKAGEGLELAVIAAVVVGGARLQGGQGTVGRTLVGVLIIGVLGNGVNLYNVPVEVQYILIGLIIIANIALAQWRVREQV